MRPLISGGLSLLLVGMKDVLAIQTLESKDRGRELKLEQTPSGLWLVSNRGYPDTWEDINNMLMRWALADPAQRAEPFRAATTKLGFSYIDSHWGDHLVLGDDDSSIEQAFQVVDRAITNKLCDKVLFHLAAKETGVDGDLVPRTFTTKEEALQELSPGEVDIVFVKERHGTLGNGITILSMQDLRDADIPPDCIIQEGLTKNLALLHGAKVTLRVYFVVMHGRVYIHHMAWIDFQDHLFDPKNKSMAIHMSHAGGTGHLDLRFPRRTPEHVDGSEVIWGAGKHFQVEAVVNGAKWMDGLVIAGRKAGPLLEPIVRETRNDPMRFLFIGADLVPLEDGSFKLLEVNTYPSFRRSDVFTDVILRALHMEEYDRDLETRLVEVWKLPDQTASDDGRPGDPEVKIGTSDETEKGACSMEENVCLQPSGRVWEKSIYTASEYIVAGRNLAEYNGTNSPHYDDCDIPPFELFDTFDMSANITGDEGWWDLMKMKTKWDDPMMSWYADKVARKRWLPTRGIKQPMVYSLKYRKELTESQELNDETEAIMKLLPNQSDYVVKPSHKTVGDDGWLAGYDAESGVSGFSRVPREMEPAPEAEMKPRIAANLAQSLHETCRPTSSVHTSYVKPGIVIEERWTHPFHNRFPPLEFKMVTIWGRVWVGALISPEADGRHIHAYIYRNGSTAPGSGYAKTPDWIDWEHLVAVAEKLSANKDLARTDIFAGIPAGSLGPDATWEEQLAAIKYGLNEVDMAPHTIWFQCGISDGCENDLSLEGARLWLAGYKMGNYKVVPNTEVPKEWVESSGYYPEIQT